MIRIEVQYFARFRELAGCASESLDSEAGTARDLFAECCERNPGLAELEHMKVAVNDELCAWDSALSDGDTVLFFPPVSGG